MLVTETLFTDAAVIKVFAYTAFVADSKDRRLLATIALDIVHRTFFNNSLFFLFKVKILASKQFIKNLLGLLVKFCLNEVLESFTRNTFSTEGAILALLSSGFFCIQLPSQLAC